MADDDARPRFIPPGSCSWCGHPPHGPICPATIRISLKGATTACPCARHKRV